MVDQKEVNSVHIQMVLPFESKPFPLQYIIRAGMKVWAELWRGATDDGYATDQCDDCQDVRRDIKYFWDSRYPSESHTLCVACSRRRF
jgi:hypothetical protein